MQWSVLILLQQGKVKQIVGSTLKDTAEGAEALVTNFESDKSPAEFAKMYKADGLKGGHLIMLAADPLSKSAAIEALREYPGIILYIWNFEVVADPFESYSFYVRGY